MAAALKSQDKQMNVIIADWLTSAHQHYPIAVQNTRYIGQEIADFLEWLEVRAPDQHSFLWNRPIYLFLGFYHLSEILCWLMLFISITMFI